MFNVIKKGVHYSVKNLTGEGRQDIIFTHRHKGVAIEGITLEDLYGVILDRLKSINERFPKYENTIQIKHIELAIESQKVIIKKNINDAKCDT